MERENLQIIRHIILNTCGNLILFYDLKINILPQFNNYSLKIFNSRFRTLKADISVKHIHSFNACIARSRRLTSS